MKCRVHLGSADTRDVYSYNKSNRRMGGESEEQADTRKHNVRKATEPAIRV